MFAFVAKLQLWAKLSSSSTFIHSRHDSLLREPNKQSGERKKHVIKSSDSHRGAASKKQFCVCVYRSQIWVAFHRIIE